MKIIKKNISEPIKASFFFMVASVLQQSVNLVTTPIFTRILSQNDYGVINVYQSWLGILTVIITLSLSSGVYNNAMIDFKNEINEFTSSMLTLSSLSTLIFFLIYLCFRNYINNMMNLPVNLIYLMFITILLNPAMLFWMAKQRFEYKYKLSITISILITIGNAILSYIFVIYGNADKVLGKIFGSIILTLIFSLIIYISIFIRGKKLVSLKYWKYALAFNLPLIPHYLSNIVLSQSDRILISKMVGNTEAGLYSLAYSASSVITIVWNSINASWIPWTLKKMNDKKYKDIGKVANGIVVICVIACTGFIAFAPEIIKILAAPSYYKAIWVMPPVILGVYFTFIASLFANIEFYYKTTKFIMLASSSVAILNIILNLIFIPILGYIASAYTTLISYVVLSVIHYKFMKKIDKNNIYDIKFISVVSLGLIIISFFITIFYNNIIIRYFIIIALIILILLKKNLFLSIWKQLKE